MAPLSVRLAPDTALQPDILFIAKERELADGPYGEVLGAPDLVIEILSPSTAHRDRGAKLQSYGTYGVREYWIVDPHAETIEVLTQQGAGLDTWQRFMKESILTSSALPGLKLDLGQIFTY